MSWYCAVISKDRNSNSDRESLKRELCRHTVLHAQQRVRINDVLPTSGFSSILHHSKLHFGPGVGLEARGRPRRGHSILLWFTKKSTGCCRDLFFPGMIHRRWLLGFISGGSLLPCLFLRWDHVHLMHFQYKELRCCVIPRGAGHDSGVLLIGPGKSLQLLEFLVPSLSLSL